jgi:UDP-glucose 4-epimerase
MILITGGLGFIGLHTAAAFLAVGESVVLTKHRSSHLPDFLADHLERRLFVEAVDLSDTAALQGVLTKHAVDGIVHLAAPPLSVESVHSEFEMNLSGLIAVLEAARARQVRRITIGSSIAVYRSLPRGPFREETALPVEARIGVEAFKKSFEVLADYHARQTGLDIVCLRISSIYGPLYRSLVNAPSRMVHAAVRNVSGPLHHHLAPDVFSDGAVDLLYVEDCARGIQQVQLAARLNHRIYNLGAGRAISPGEFAAAVRRVVPRADLRLQDGAGPHHRPDAFEDLERVHADVGFEVQHTPESAVEKYVAWLQRGNAH